MTLYKHWSQLLFLCSERAIFNPKCTGDPCFSNHPKISFFPPLNKNIISVFLLKNALNLVLSFPILFEEQTTGASKMTSKFHCNNFYIKICQ